MDAALEPRDVDRMKADKLRGLKLGEAQALS
jgi:hypothetical protein